jgi:hypothetical protein
MTTHCNLLQEKLFPAALDRSCEDGPSVHCRSSSPGKNVFSAEVEKTLVQANRDAVRVSYSTEHSLPLAAKIILRRQSSRKPVSTNRMIRPDLARSLAHTLANLS